jgi:GxxExxY protein
MTYDKIIFKDLSYKIVKTLFDVHNSLGPGFSENIYEKALIEELKNQGLKFSNQKVINITYNNKTIGVHKLDFVIEDKIVLEIKAQMDLLPVHLAQLRSYLKSGGYKLGILANFGKEKVEYKRVLL